MRVAFLLGSGISIPCGMPSTRQITEKILSGNGVSHDYADTYSLQDGEVSDCDNKRFVPLIVGFVEFLRKLCLAYRGAGTSRDVNYEELYYIAKQLYDSERGDFENPALLYLRDEISRAFLSDARPFPFKKTVELISKEAATYMETVVCELLTREGDVSKLRCLHQVCNDDGVSGVDFFTLNHDLVLEQMLDGEKTKYVDGFGTMQQNGVRYWQPEVYENSQLRVRLFKLHGSVNWGNFPHPDSGLRTGILCDQRAYAQFEDSLENSAFSGSEMNDKPRILIGTFNKVLMYTVDVFFDLYERFRRYVKEADCLVVSGYSFGDKMVNDAVLGYIRSSADKRLLIVHPDVEELRKHARVAVKDRWQHLETEGKLVSIAAGIEKVNWDEMKRAMSDRRSAE